MEDNAGRKRTAACMAGILLLTGTDWFTKLLAVRFLKGGERISLLTDILALEYYENFGAAFNSFADRRIFLIIATVPVIVILVCKLFQTLEEPRYFGISAGICLVIAGGIGNCIDRVVKGYVVDFIYFMPIDFPKFNLADVYVVAGIVLVGLLLLLYYGEADISNLLRMPGK